MMSVIIGLKIDNWFQIIHQINLNSEYEDENEEFVEA